MHSRVGNMTPYTVAVRSLCAFSAKSGDLDLRFTPAPSAQEGVAGHATLRARRKAGYRSEIAVEGVYESLLVRGRVDGYDPHLNRLEEIKTYRGDLARMPDNHRQLHWAQARIYGWLLCQQLGVRNIDVALVYFNIDDQTETVLCTSYSDTALQSFFNDCCATFVAWADRELAHGIGLNAALARLTFPHPAFRPGQRELAEAAFRAVRNGCAVLMQAPTGIGKTIGTLFPVLKARPLHQIDRIFYLAAKTSGRQLALDGLRLLATHGKLPLRVIELVARDKACEHPEAACHGASCPLARGFYDRLAAARQAMLAEVQFDKDALRRVALAHQICPYYLGQEMARWSDVCVGDYNYFFDHGGMLHDLAVEQQWRVVTLVDEAHNLVERARKMYSAELWQTDLQALRQNAGGALKIALDRLQRQWRALSREQTDACQSYDAVPVTFVDALQRAVTAIHDHLAQSPAEPEPALQQFAFALTVFARLAESFGDHSLFDVEMRNAKLSTLSIRNLVPAPFLTKKFAAAQAAILFSATLNPWRFYVDMLGLPETTPWTDVPSPFDASQLTVQVASGISTRWKARAASVTPIATLLGNQYRARPGNYLAFFSSFDYLAQVADAFMTMHPDITVWQQAREMDEAARVAFLAHFAPGGCGVGFAVLGGAFGEGIDLPGDRLIGAWIATLGLPQVNRYNEQLRTRLEQKFAAGYDYAYLYPGLQKVVQAAGRVIRSSTDQGSVVLIDDRFDEPRVRALLPSWWAISAP